MLKRYTTIVSTALTLMVSTLAVKGQTNPTPVAIPYNQNFGATAFTTLPSGFAGWQPAIADLILTQADAEASQPAANATIAALIGASSSSTSPAIYGQLPSGTNARVLISTSSGTGVSDRVDQLVLAINTFNHINISVQFLLTGVSGTANTGLVFQWRPGSSGPWSTLSTTNNPYLGNRTDAVTVTAALPSTANNEPFIQVRWATWNGNTNNGANGRFRVGIDDISVSGTFSPPPPGPGGVTRSNLWLMGNLGTAPASGTLTSWVDQSGKNNTTTIVGIPQTGGTTVNYNNSILLNGTTDYITVPSSPNLNTSNFTINVATKHRPALGFEAIVSSRTDNGGFGGFTLYANSSGANAIWELWAGDGTSFAKRIETPSLPNDVWRLLTIKYDGTALSLYVDGQIVGSPVPFSLVINSALPFYIGAGTTAGAAVAFQYRGEIAELAYYGRSLTVADQLRVESYMALKYGITLSPTVGNYVNSAVSSIWSNTFYWNDVFGVGRDDASIQNQLQSNSMNTGSGNGVGQTGKGNIIIRTDLGLNNNQFLMIGHDPGALQLTTINLPPSLPARFNRFVRQWKAINTALVGIMALTFDLNGITFTEGVLSTSPADYRIIIDTDGDENMATGTITAIQPTQVSGNVLFFQNLLLPNNATFTFALKLTPFTNVWNGSVNTLWSNPANWSRGVVPSSNDIVIVNGATYTNKPTLDVPFTVGTTLEFTNNPDFAIAPGGMLSIAAGASADLGTTNQKEILSNSTGSGLIGKIEGTIIAGNSGDAWKVERWFNARRSFRYVCSPVNGSAIPANTIRQLWMGGDALGKAYNYPYSLGSPEYSTQGSFLHITGPYQPGQAHANGFDENQTGNPSFWQWSPSTQSWVAYPLTNFILQSGLGTRLVVRGDRGINLDINLPPATSTKIFNVGALNTGNYAVPAARFASLPNEYSLIANPYQSVVDAALINKTGVTNFYYMWDANVVGTAGFGAFVTVDIATNTSSMKPGAIGTSQANRYIQPGQAVFFQNDNTNSPRSITFTEASKAGVGNQTQIFGIEDGPEPASDQVLWMTLSAESQEEKTTNVIDGSVIRFGNDYTNTASTEDGNKLNNPNETIGVDNGGNFIAIEKRSMPVDGEIIPLKIIRYRSINYTLQLDAAEMSISGMDAFLKDKFLNKETLIIAGQVLDYPFTVASNDAASTAADRFSIVFRKSEILPITGLQLQASQLGSAVELQWLVSGDHYGTTYGIERSMDGRSFTQILELQGKGTGGSQPVTYSEKDVQPFNGNNFYRIKAAERDGKITYSNIAKVSLGQTSQEGFEVFPNPVVSNVLQISLKGLDAGRYDAILYNAAGQVLQTTAIEHNGGSASRQINLQQKHAHGTYRLVLQRGNKRYVQSILINE